MKLLLTGAAGRLGSATFRQLVDAGLEVRATDVMRKPDLPGKVLVGDLLNREFCYNVVEDISVIVHLANLPNQMAGTPQKVFNDNVTMNMNLFQAAVESGANKIVYASSIQATMGTRTAKADAKSPLPYLPLDGDIRQYPGNPYALSKCVGEQQLEYFVKHHTLNSAVAVRFPMIMPKHLFGHWRNRANPAHIDPSTCLDEVFTWVAVDDAAKLLLASVKAELPGYRCYFPAHPAPRVKLTPREIIERFFAGVPLKKPVEEMDCLIDISRITAETGWVPTENFWDA